MKKILFLNPWLAMGGLEKVLVNLANALSERGHEVTIKTIANESTLAKFLHPAVKYQVIPRKSFWLANKVKGVWRVLNYENWFKYSSPRTLYNYYVKDEYDVEIAFFRGHSIKIISGSTNKRAKKLAWVHSDALYCKGLDDGFSNMQMAKRAYRKFDHIICVSQQAKESFAKVMGYAEKLRTIYNINPVREIQLAADEPMEIASNQFTIVAVGRLAELKGFDRLLEACALLNREGLVYTLWIVGDGGDRQKLAALAADYSLENVVFLGMQENPYKFIRAADLLVCSSRYEGYCLVVAEALILGTPVVSTRCTGPSEILADGEYGMLVDNSIEGIVDGLRAMMTNQELLRHYQQQAILRSPFFDSNNILDQIERLFDES